MKEKPIQSYLYDFINTKYINNSKVIEFKQGYLEEIKKKSEFNEIEEFVNENFFDTIEDFFNDKGKEILGDKLGNDNLKNIIKNFEKKIGDKFIFRYYQYLSILYTYFIFHIVKNKDLQNKFITEFKEYLKSYNIELKTEFDLRRLNYWMATGSGKTYLMYFIFELYLNIFGKNSVDDIFLIVPAGLRNQHIKELENIYNCNFTVSTNGNDTTYISNILNKNIILTSVGGFDNIIKNKEINLEIGKHIFIYDEGHKGAGGNGATKDNKKKTEGNKKNTKSNKQDILKNKNNFIFDYSATFQEVIKNEISEKKGKKKSNKDNVLKIDSLNKYFLSSIYNYNLTYFQDDGYGKKISYYLGNLSEEEQNKDDINITKENLKKALESFNIQLKEFEKEKNNKENIKFYKPLFLGVSNEIGSNTKANEEQKNNLIDVINSLIELNNKGDLDELFNYKNKDKDNKDNKDKISFDIGKEEILIKIGDKKGLIYVGSSGIKKIAEEFKKKEDKINISQNHKDGVFKNLDNQEDVVFLFGSKKFIEGWNSKRPSTIFLLKGAKTSTIQAVQLLGRGLRLSGYNNDGYRHLSDKSNLNPLETLFLYGQDVNALKDFLEKSSNTDIKIVKFDITQPKDNLDSLKLPYLKAQENEKSNYIKIKLGEDNIKLINNINIELNNIKIPLHKEYKKVAKSIANGDKRIKDTNLNIIDIPYIILKPYIENIINDFNLSNKNKVIFNIENNFFEELLKELTFKENVGMNRNEKRRFILSIIKNILNTIYYKIHKKIKYTVDTIKKDDKDIKFEYSIAIQINKEDDEKVFGLKLREDKKYERIIELREDNLSEWFEVEDDKNLENKIKELEKQENNELLNFFKKNFLKESGVDTHLYKRLFCLYNSDEEIKDTQKKDGITDKLDKNIKKENIEISPSSILNLNKFEVEIINKILNGINKDKYEYKEIYFFRNPPTGNKYFLYKNEDGGISKFYPDFIFWFKKENGKYDILYIDPKGNDEEKKNKEKCLIELNNTFCKEKEQFKETIKKLLNDNYGIYGLDNKDNNKNTENLNHFDKSILNNNNIDNICGVIVSKSK